MQPARTLAKDLVATLRELRSRRRVDRRRGRGAGEERRVDERGREEVRFARVELKVGQSTDVLGVRTREVSLDEGTRAKKRRKGQLALAGCRERSERQTHEGPAKVNRAVLLGQLCAAAAVEADRGGAREVLTLRGGGRAGRGRGRNASRDGGAERCGSGEECRAKGEGQGRPHDGEHGCGCGGFGRSERRNKVRERRVGSSCQRWVELSRSRRNRGEEQVTGRGELMGSAIPEEEEEPAGRGRAVGGTE